MSESVHDEAATRLSAATAFINAANMAQAAAKAISDADSAAAAAGLGPVKMSATAPVVDVHPNIKPQADEVASALIILNGAIARKYGPGAKVFGGHAAPFIKWGWITWITAMVLGLNGCSIGLPTMEFSLEGMNPIGWISSWFTPSDKARPGYSGVVPQSADDMLSLLKKKGEGLHVLYVYETKDKLTPGQDSAMFAQSVRDYLQAHCAVGADGKTKEFREYSPRQDISHETPFWQELMAQAQGKPLPYLIITK